VPRQNLESYVFQKNYFKILRLNNDPLHFARPLIDLRDLGIAHHPFHMVFFHKAVAAMDLHRFSSVHIAASDANTLAMEELSV
jgi:hypothetical protein